MQEEVGRVTRQSETARKSYNRMSRWYDLLSNRFESKFRDIGINAIEATGGETLLEIGFGTGHCIVALAKSIGSTGMVYGIDISDGMLQIANNRVRKAGLTEAAHLERGDAMQLPFKEELFDAIFMSFTLELFHSTEIPTVLSQCRRVLKKGGRICVVSLSKKEQPGLMIKLYLWAHHKFPGLIDCRPIYVQDDLEEAGFLTMKSTQVKKLGLPVEIVLARKSGGVPANTEAVAIELQPAA
jgi:demethylmenaquinone methyltransferase/2-methoxy-6-polyprenyl-1,4-benzoquinol methylase